MSFKLVLNDHAIHEMLNDREGPVARDLQRRAINVESQAKLNASGPPGPNVITGRLRSSITGQVAPFGLGTRDNGDLVARIGTNVEYAEYVEEKKPYLERALEAARI